MSAPAEVSLFPPNNPEAGVELPRGLPAAAPPKSPGAGEADVVAGFPPNRDGLGWLEPLDWFCPPNSPDPACVPPPVCGFCAPNSDGPACVFCAPKRLGPGGAPAGVVDGRNLFVAGVAAGVDAVALC